MCKKSKFPLVFNIFLAFFITLVVTIFVKAGEGALTPESFICLLYTSDAADE